jgi:hypothetical protein
MNKLMRYLSMRKTGIEIETFAVAGRYQHRVYDLNGDSNKRGAISKEIIENQKRVNEQIWDENPQGSGKIVSRILYRVPRKR